MRYIIHARIVIIMTVLIYSINHCIIAYTQYVLALLECTVCIDDMLLRHNFVYPYDIERLSNCHSSLNEWVDR